MFNSVNADITKGFPTSLYLYPKSFLSLSRGYPRDELSYGYRHVESWLYTGGAIYWFPHISRRKRARTTFMYHGGPGGT